MSHAYVFYILDCFLFLFYILFLFFLFFIIYIQSGPKETEYRIFQFFLYTSTITSHIYTTYNRWYKSEMWHTISVWTSKAYKYTLIGLMWLYEKFDVFRVTFNFYILKILDLFYEIPVLWNCRWTLTNSTGSVEFVFTSIILCRILFAIYWTLQAIDKN